MPCGHVVLAYKDLGIGMYVPNSLAKANVPLLVQQGWNIFISTGLCLLMIMIFHSQLAAMEHFFCCSADV